MKQTTVLIVLLCFLVNTRGYSQKITMDVKMASQIKIYNEIKKQSGYRFIFDKLQVSRIPPRNFNVTYMDPEEVIKYLFKNSPLTYSIEGKYFIIKENKNWRSNDQWPAINILPIINVEGQVTNEKDEPVANATVIDKNSDKYAITDSTGNFKLSAIHSNTALIITSISHETLEFQLQESNNVHIQVKVKPTELTEVLVSPKGSTGYKPINREKDPGSFSIINTELLNRKVGSLAIDRIENLVSGLSSRNPIDGLLIRDRNSIYANVNPLIILDNFPYVGDIKNINPNDIESISVLKDATATSMWGGFGGNGVIVITTKKGKTSKLQVEFSSNMSIQQKPNLSRLRTMNSNDAVEVQAFLYEKGFYNSDILSPNNIIPPVVEFLLLRDSGKITQQGANSELAKLRSNNVYNDLEKYFYQNTIQFQQFVNLSLNIPKINSYTSIGWDKNPGSLVGQKDDRITINNRQEYTILSKLKIGTSLTYTHRINQSLNNPGIGLNSGAGKGLNTYADLVDVDNNPMELVRDFRSGYTDTAGAGYLQNWKYKPYEDLYQGKSIGKAHDLLLNLNIDYSLTSSLSVALKYQFENSWMNGKVLNKETSYMARDLVNRFYQPGATNPYKVPIGGILDIGNSYLQSHQGRVQLNYDRYWGPKYSFQSMAGWEIKDVTFTSESYRLYKDNGIANSIRSNMDFENPYPQYDNPLIKIPIPNPQSNSSKLDRYISYYAIVSYTFDNRYIVSITGRKDVTNLFGADQKGVPLWSVGANWKISNELFYNIGWLPYLNIRSSFGYKGNFSREASARTTVSMFFNDLGIAEATVQTPANKKLRWEKTQMMNMGFDFEIGSNISGSFECYFKKSSDVLSKYPIDGTTGLTPSNAAGGTAVLFGNGSASKGNGFEVEVNSTNIKREFNWSTTFIFSHSVTKISTYLLPPPEKSKEYISLKINPIVGKPLFGLYSYRWAGLNEKGDPVGYMGKNKSTDWTNIINQTKPDSLKYHGPAQCPNYGSLRNTFTWKNVSLSAMISFYLGFYFRKNSISYTNTFNNWIGHSDYALRWQNPGDENKTNVPALVYLNNAQLFYRDMLFLLSEVNVLKGDHIRLEDIKLEYTIHNEQQKLPFKQMKVYGYVSNLGIIWKANKAGIDPYYPEGNINRKSFAFGFNLIF